MKELFAKYHVCAKTIRTWINKISETDDRDLTYSVRRRQRKNRFSEDFCKAIVARYEAGEAISALCEEVKIDRSILYRWINFTPSIAEIMERSLPFRILTVLLKKTGCWQKKIKYSDLANVIPVIP